MVDPFSVFVGGKISVRVPTLKILLISSTIAGFGSLMFGTQIGADPYFLLISIMVFGVGIGLSTVPIMTYIMDLLPHSRGAALGMTNFVRLIGAAMASFCGQFVREVLSSSHLFYLSAILIFITVFLVWWVCEEKRIVDN